MSSPTRNDGICNAHAQILAALVVACAAEKGGWATPLPVARHLNIKPAGVSQTLCRLVRNGHVEVWSPQGVGNTITSFFRPLPDAAPSTSQYRVAVINAGTPFGPLHIAASDAADAERTRVSWSTDPETPEAQVWVERREIGPWTRTDRS